MISYTVIFLSVKSSRLPGQLWRAFDIKIPVSRNDLWLYDDDDDDDDDGDDGLVIIDDVVDDDNV